MGLSSQWRKVFAVDIGLFMLATFFLAWLPPKTLVVPETFMMALSTISFIGVISHSIQRVRLPLEEWAYLVSSAVCLLNIIAYATVPAPPYTKLVIALFLGSGTITGWAAHVIDGGRPNSGG